MVFNPCISWDFMPDLNLDKQELEELRLLGVIVRSDMKWTSNTEHLLVRAYKIIWSLRQLKGMGATVEDMKDVYQEQVKIVLELVVPAWNGALTQADAKDIERVKKSYLKRHFCFKLVRPYVHIFH